MLGDGVEVGVSAMSLTVRVQTDAPSFLCVSANVKRSTRWTKTIETQSHRHYQEKRIHTDDKVEVRESHASLNGAAC